MRSRAIPSRHKCCLVNGRFRPRESVCLHGTFDADSDADWGDLALLANNLGSVTITDADQPVARFSAAIGRPHVFRLTVSDGTASASETTIVAAPPVCRRFGPHPRWTQLLDAVREDLAGPAAGADMKVVWSEAFYQDYSGDPASTCGRMEPIVEALEGWAEWVEPESASEKALVRCHTQRHLQWVRQAGVYDVACLAAGGAIRAAHIGRTEPAFALVRPPGHHASSDQAWGFCYFNNVAVALTDLRAEGLVEKAFVLDFDLHFGDGTVNIFAQRGWVEILNPGAPTRKEYLFQAINALEGFEGDYIAVSAGFDNHQEDWGGLLHTEDYGLIGLQVGIRARALGAGCFAVLEGGYNHAVLGENVREFLHGLEKGWIKGASGQADRA